MCCAPLTTTTQLTTVTKGFGATPSDCRSRRYEHVALVRCRPETIVIMKNCIGFLVGAACICSLPFQSACKRLLYRCADHNIARAFAQKRIQNILENGTETPGNLGLLLTPPFSPPFPPPLAPSAADVRVAIPPSLYKKRGGDFLRRTRGEVGGEGGMEAPHSQSCILIIVSCKSGEGSGDPLAGVWVVSVSCLDVIIPFFVQV